VACVDTLTLVNFAAFECVPTTTLWLSSAASVNDELYRGFRKGNAFKQINEFPVGTFVMTMLAVGIYQDLLQKQMWIFWVYPGCNICSYLSHCSLWLRAHQCICILCGHMVQCDIQQPNCAWTSKSHSSFSVPEYGRPSLISSVCYSEARFQS
jgi:hypothetical protein